MLLTILGQYINKIWLKFISKNCRVSNRHLLFCYERVFMLSLSDNNRADIVKAFNSSSRYLHDLFNINNPY